MIVDIKQIKAWEAIADNACNGYPEMEKVRECVRDMSPEDGLHICLLTLEELEGWGTVCGSLTNKCFHRDVIDFLLLRGVKFAIVGIIPDEDDPTNYLIAGGALPLPFGDESAELSDLINTYDGSWRDDCCIEGWSSYESE